MRIRPFRVRPSSSFRSICRRNSGLRSSKRLERGTAALNRHYAAILGARTTLSRPSVANDSSPDHYRVLVECQLSRLKWTPQTELGNPSMAHRSWRRTHRPARTSLRALTIPSVDIRVWLPETRRSVSSGYNFVGTRTAQRKAISEIELRNSINEGDHQLSRTPNFGATVSVRGPEGCTPVEREVRIAA